MSAVATAEHAVSTGGRFHRTKPYSRTELTRGLCGVTLGMILERQAVEDVPDAKRCRRCWSRPVGARLEKSSMAQRQGIRATADGGTCDRCDEPILKDQRIVKRESTSGERWVHAGCASGQDQ